MAETPVAVSIADAFQVWPWNVLAKNDTIQINCKFEAYELIHHSVVAAAKKAKWDGNERQLMALMGVLLTLSSAEGITAHHLSDFNLWDMD